jgi:hypothetical protein
MLRETLASELGLDRSRVGFAEGLLDDVPDSAIRSLADVVTLVSDAVRENLRLLRLAVRLSAAADLTPQDLYSCVNDAGPRLYDGAPPAGRLPRHEAGAHVRGQPCFDDAVAFLWTLVWSCDPHGLSKPAEGPLSRRSFPSPLECTEMQLGFWNALMAGVSPDEHAPIDLASGGRVLSDAEVAIRCSELRRPDPATPVHLLGRLGRCFRDAAYAATVAEDKKALLLRAEAAYEAVHRATGKGAGATSTVPVPGPSVSFNKSTAAGTPQRGGGGVGSSVGTPRSSYPSPFRARQLGQTQSPRSVAGSPLAPYSPLAQLAHRRARAPSPAQGAASTLLTGAGAAVEHPASEDDVRRLIVECVVLCFAHASCL